MTELNRIERKGGIKETGLTKEKNGYIEKGGRFYKRRNEGNFTEAQYLATRREGGRDRGRDCIPT